MLPNKTTDKTQRKTTDGGTVLPENKINWLWHYISIITLNTNGLNSPIKKHRVAAWIKKNNNNNHMLLSGDISKLQKQS